MFGITKVPKTSPIAVLDGPGCPTLVLQLFESFSTASRSGGLLPYGSLSSHSSSFGARLAKAGKSYSFELAVAWAKFSV